MSSGLGINSPAYLAPRWQIYLYPPESPLKKPRRIDPLSHGSHERKSGKEEDVKKRQNRIKRITRSSVIHRSRNAPDFDDCVTVSHRLESYNDFRTILSSWNLNLWSARHQWGLPRNNFIPVYKIILRFGNDFSGNWPQTWHRNAISGIVFSDELMMVSVYSSRSSGSIIKTEMSADLSLYAFARWLKIKREMAPKKDVQNVHMVWHCSRDALLHLSSLQFIEAETILDIV